MTSKSAPGLLLTMDSARTAASAFTFADFCGICEGQVPRSELSGASGRLILHFHNHCCLALRRDCTSSQHQLCGPVMPLPFGQLTGGRAVEEALDIFLIIRRMNEKAGAE